MRIRNASALLVAALLTAGAAALADEVVKKDGTVIQGEIIGQDAGGVTIRHKFGDNRIPRNEIASISTSSKAFEPELERIKLETTERLERLARDADAAGRSEEARALREAAADVRAWTLSPKLPKPEKPYEPRLIDPPSSQPKSSPAPPKAEPAKGDVKVKGYIKKDGTVVQPYTRHRPGEKP